MLEPLLHFVETPIFTRRIDKLTSIETLFDLQNDLIRNPKLGDIIQGTNGSRKARIGERQQKRGKSGAFRYIYLYLETAQIIYLMFIFAKNEQDNLTDRQKKELGQLSKEIKSKYGEKEMDKELFSELKESFNQALQHANGERSDLRTTTLPRPPKKLSSSEIVDLRSQLNASQSVFAHYLNVSVKTVQAWEQGIGKPSGAALKLLTIIKKRPQVLFET